MKIEIGRSYVFLTTQSDLLKYNGTKAYVIRPLTDKEADLYEVGNMYLVRFEDGAYADAFEDELTEETLDCKKEG